MLHFPGRTNKLVWELKILFFFKDSWSSFSRDKKARGIYCAKSVTKTSRHIFPQFLSHTSSFFTVPADSIVSFPLFEVIRFKNRNVNTALNQQPGRTLSNYFSKRDLTKLETACGTSLAAAYTLGKSTPIRLWLGSISQAAAWHALLEAPHT